MEKSTGKRIGVPRLRAILDLGLYWGWMSVAFFSTALAGSGGIPSVETANLIALAVSTAVVVAVAFLPPALPWGREAHPWPRVAGVAAGSVGTFLVLSSPLLSPLFVAGSCLLGFGEGFLLYLFVCRAMRVCQSAEDVVVLFSWALIVASVLYVGGLTLGSGAGVFCVLLPLFTLGGLIKAKDEAQTPDGAPAARIGEGKAAEGAASSAADAPWADLRRLPWKLLLGLAVFGIAFGLMRVSASTAPVEVFQTSYLAHTVARAAMAVLAILLIGKLGKAYWVLSTIQLLAFTLGVCGYWLPFESTAVLTVGATTAGYTCLELLLWAVLFELFLETRMAFNVLYGVIRGLVSLATLIAAAYALFVMSAMDSTVVHLVLLFLLLAMILVSSLLFGSRNVASLWGLERHTVSAAQMDSEDAVAQVAQRYNLTARETEVMALLMKGRNEPFISEALFISPGTTHSHVSHIYSKVGVHSRQELLDVVEKQLAEAEVS